MEAEDSSLREDSEPQAKRSKIISTHEMIIPDTGLQVSTTLEARPTDPVLESSYHCNPDAFYPLQHCAYPSYPAYYYTHTYMGSDGVPIEVHGIRHDPPGLGPSHPYLPVYDLHYDPVYLAQKQAATSKSSSNYLEISTEKESEGSGRQGEGGQKMVARISKGRLRWSREMDELLKQGVEVYKNCGVGMWKKIAEYMSYTFLDEYDQRVAFCITNHQCGERFKHHIDPSLSEKIKTPWTDEEVEQLLQLVTQHQTPSPTPSKPPLINWIAISSLLNRPYRDCQHKYINFTKASLKQGPFTREEEELIIARVREYGGEESKGVWGKIEKEIGRRGRSIQDKYRRMMKKIEKTEG